MNVVVITYENGLKKHTINHSAWPKIPYHSILLVYWQNNNGSWNNIQNKDYYFIYEKNGVVRIGGLDSPQNYTDRGFKTEFQLEEISKPNLTVKRGIWVSDEVFIEATNIKI